MNNRLVLGTVVLLSILCWFWFLDGNWSLGFTLANLIFLGTATYVHRRSFRPFSLTLGIISVLVSAFVAIRSFEFVKFLSWLSVFALDFLFVAYLRAPRAIVNYGRLIRSWFGLIPTIPSSFGRLLSLLSASRFSFTDRRLVVLKGVLYSLPLLLIFGWLFYSADPIFAKLIDQIHLPQINIQPRIIGDLVFTFLFASTALSFFRAKFATRIRRTLWLKQITETNIAVGILEILFAVFTAIQLRYFFAPPQTFFDLGIIYSNYTREGYQQMIFAALLALVVILRLDYSLKSQKHSPIKTFTFTRSLALLLVLETFILVISATKRNYMYQLAYGYTEIRLLGFSLSAWMVAMLALIGYKVLRRQTTDLLTRGTVVITALGVLGLNLANIDSIVVNQNLPRTGQGTDYEYLSTLSDDASDAWDKILTNIEVNYSNSDLNQIRRFQVQLGRLRSRLRHLENLSQNNWNYGGNWNWSNYQSLQILSQNKSRLTQISDQLDQKTQQLRQVDQAQAKTELSRLATNALNNLQSHSGQVPTVISVESVDTNRNYYELKYSLRLNKKITANDEFRLMSVVREFSDKKCTLTVDNVVYSSSSSKFLMTCTAYYTP